MNTRLRQAVLIVALANLGWFFVEFFVAKRIGSVSLFADSVDFLEDTAVNLLVFTAMAWSARRRARVGMLLALLLLAPVVASIWTAIQKLLSPAPPEAMLLSATGFGALLVNSACAFLLAHFRDDGGSLTRAAFLSARNDVLANIAVISAGVITLFWSSGWPDLAVGACIAFINADAARDVWKAANKEYVQHRA